MGNHTHRPGPTCGGARPPEKSRAMNDSTSDAGSQLVWTHSAHMAVVDKLQKENERLKEGIEANADAGLGLEQQLKEKEAEIERLRGLIK